MKKKALLFIILALLSITVTVSFFIILNQEEPPKHEMSVKIENTSLVVGQTQSVEVSVSNMENITYDCYIDNEEVVAFDKNEEKIVAIGVGNATVTFVLNNDATIKKSISVSVSAMPTCSVTIGNGNPIIVQKGQTITAPTAPQQYQDDLWVYTFDCFVKQGTDSEWDFSNPITEDLILEEKWNKAERKYIVEIDGQLSEYSYNDLIAKPVDKQDYTSPTKHFIFDGWYIDNTQTKWDFSTDKVNRDGIKLVSRFIQQTRYYTVTFIVDGESVTDYYEYNQSLVLPSNPTKQSNSEYEYQFSHWEGLPTDNKVVQDLNLVAVFNKIAIYSSVSGKIVDKELNGIVATIKVGNEQVCTCNEDGSFSFKIKISDDNITLGVYANGYYSKQKQFIATQEQTDLGTISLDIIEYNYSVEIYQEDINGIYSLVDSYIDTASSLIRLSPQEKEHYLVDENQSVLEGNAINDLVLKVYYKRKIYRITYYIDGEEYFVDNVKYERPSLAPFITPKENYTARWDKSVDCATADTDINAIYELSQKYKICVNIQAQKVSVLQNAYDTFEVNEEFYNDAKISVYDESDNPVLVDGLVAVVSKGTYKVQVEYNGYTYTKKLEIENKDEQVEFICSNTLLGGSVDENQSFISENKQYLSADEVKVSSYDITFVDGQKSNRYYIESEISFTSKNGKGNAGLVGIMPLASSEKIDDKNGAKVVVGILQDGSLAYTYKKGWEQQPIILCNLKDKIQFDANNYSYKLGIYRNDSEVYIFVNGEYITSLSFGLFNESGFGLASCVDNTHNGAVKFSSYIYTYNAQLLDDLQNSIAPEMKCLYATLDSDYIISGNAKIYLSGDYLDDETAQKISIKINDYNNILIKTVIGAKRNFNLLLNKGNYRVQAEYAGRVITTTKEKIIKIKDTTNEVSFDISFSQIGGEYCLDNGEKVCSSKSNYTITQGDKITINSDCYVFADDISTDTAYIEGKFNIETTGLFGFAMNYTGANLVKFGLMLEGKGLNHYLCVSDTAYTDYGTNVGSVESKIVENKFKMGVLRIKDYYRVYINDNLVWEGEIIAKDENGNLLENNISGFGVYGTNFCGKGNREISDIKYTTNLSIINSIFNVNFSIDIS